MDLVGILSQSLGGFTCIRGYAPLGDLAKISFADPSFQRSLIESQKERIIAFLENREFLFFPEVVLSYTLKYDYREGIGLSGIAPLKDIIDRKGFKSNIEPISIRSILKSASSTHLVRIHISDTFLRSNNKPFFRIDGNHRLSASTVKDNFNEYNTPFCLILFTDSPESEGFKRVLFHNINSKSIPLTDEETLRIIIDEGNLFPDDTLKVNQSFGWHYYFTRQTIHRLDLSVLTSLKNSFTLIINDKDVESKRTILLKLYQLLLDENVALIKQEDDEINRVLTTITNINGIFFNHSILSNCKGGAVLIASIYYSLKKDNGNYFASFIDWVISNHIYEISDLNAISLITIFNSVIESNKKKIFISMDFQNHYNEHRDAIKKAIEEVESEYGMKIHFEVIRMDEVNKGFSYTISDEIRNIIKESGLLIADLSAKNENVYHEIGFLMGLNEGKELKHENFILLMRNSTDTNTEKKVGFNLRDWQQIRFDNGIALVPILKESLKKYYKLI